MRDFIKQLNEFKEIEPDEKHWHVTRSILLNTIEADTTERQGFQFKSLFFNVGIFTKTVFPTMKMATISLVVMAMVLVTGLGAQAAGPDNGLLHPFKLAMERGQLFLIRDANKTTQLRFEHIQNRLEEIDELIEKNKSKHITKATKNIESNLKQIKENLESMKNNKNVDNKKVVELASLIDLKTNELSKNLKGKEVEDKKIGETIKASYLLSKGALEVIITSDAELVGAELELIENSINNKIEIEKERFEGIGEKVTKAQNDIIKEEELKIGESVDVDVNTSTST